ncbi:MAG: hypothetical protein ACRC33_03425 [Gemmataceae bacterium]
MPMRDHFHPPLADRRFWDELHGQWPAMIVLWLNARLPGGVRGGAERPPGARRGD